MDCETPEFNQRRRLLKAGLGGLIACSLPLVPVRTDAAVLDRELTVDLRNLHTGERVKTVIWQDGGFNLDAMPEVNKVLRDHRSGTVSFIDPALMMLIARIQHRLEADEPFQVASAYRSPRTNRKLREKIPGVARRSYHTEGRAIDIHMLKVPLSTLYKASKVEKEGGVGYYPRQGFVHIDTGPVRRWKG